MNEIINIKNLTFSYNQKNNVLNNVDLKFKQGEFVSIIGPNGSGKSTLAKQFNGILLPTHGEVNVLGFLTTDSEHIIDIRKNISMVFQNPDNQIVATIVEEDVAFALENLGTEPNKIKKRVNDALKMVGMDEYKKHATYQLSGGQKQRVAIASAISTMPKCIILDEPTSMLDPAGREDVLKLISNLVKEYNITIILITHFMEEACLADRLIVMDHGKVIMDNTPKQIFAEPKQLLEIGLELPITVELCNKLKCKGYNVSQPAINITEATEVIKSILNTY